MKRHVVLLVVLVFILSCSINVFAESVKTLPVRTIGEVRYDYLEQQGASCPGGWGAYYLSYKFQVGLHVTNYQYLRELLVIPITEELWWLEAKAFQEQYFEDEAFVGEYVSEKSPFRHGFLAVQYVLTGSEGFLSEEILRFVYRDSSGHVEDAWIVHHEVYYIEGEAAANGVMIVPLPTEQITWFSLHLMHVGYVGRADMKWFLAE